MEFRDDLITGIWKFKETVSEDELASLAEELAKDEKYVQVYIRKVSKDQSGIGVTYNFGKSVKEKDFDEFMEQSKDMLYKRFGIGLVGWDFSNTTKVFKGF